MWGAAEYYKLVDCQSDVVYDNCPKPSSKFIALWINSVGKISQRTFQNYVPWPISLSIYIKKVGYPLSCVKYDRRSDWFVRRQFRVPIFLLMGTAVAQLLRCCAKNRKVAGSTLAGVIGIFYWHKILPIALWLWGRLSL